MTLIKNLHSYRESNPLPLRERTYAKKVSQKGVYHIQYQIIDKIFEFFHFDAIGATSFSLY